MGYQNSVLAQNKKLAPVLNVYNWEDYFAPSTIKDFEKKFGVKVNFRTFDEEEEMIANVQANPDKYDVVITSGESVRELAEMRLLAEIDLKTIHNLKNIEDKFRNPSYDPDQKYSVPYLWGTTGIIVNRAFIKDEANSWSILWNPEYKDKMAMLNNPDEVIAATLKMLGYSANSNNSSELEEVRQKLLEQKSLLVGYLDRYQSVTK